MIQEHQFRQLQNEFLGRVNHVELTHKRYLYHQINWDARLIGIRGARGTGKTTMLLQYIKEHYPDLNKVLYVSLDSFHFQLMSLFEVAEYAYTHEEELTGKTVILGGGLVGIELGIYLKNMGKDVEIVEMADKLNCGDNMVHEMGVNVEIDRIGLPVHTSTKALKIAKDGVACQNADGEIFFPADHVVIAAGMKGRQEEAASFAQSAPLFYQVGDCLAVKNIYEANRLGYNAAMELGTRWRSYRRSLNKKGLCKSESLSCFIRLLYQWIVTCSPYPLIMSLSFSMYSSLGGVASATGSSLIRRYFMTPRL